MIQKVLHGNWKTVTFIAALRHDRVNAPFVLEGPMTGEMFKAYVEQFLAPTLKRGDIVFMDGAVRNAVGIRCGAFSGNMKVSFQAARSIG